MESLAKYFAMAMAFLVSLVLCCVVAVPLIPGMATGFLIGKIIGALGIGLRDDAPVPPEYLAWVMRAGALCPEVGAAHIAGQIEVESGWRWNAYANSGVVPAYGISQFTEDTWPAWGKDVDGDGDAGWRNKSVVFGDEVIKDVPQWDPEDSIMAQGALMCDLVKWAKGRIAAKQFTGDPIDLAWLGYFWGRGGASRFTSVPAGSEGAYPRKVRAASEKYAAVNAPPVGPGGWTLPLRKGSYKFTSPFGPRNGRMHNGVDLAIPTGNPVFAAAAGVVRQAECDSAYCDRPGHVGLGGCGNIVDINHGGNVMTRYCHLVSFGPGIRAGAQVQAGQLVGLSGSTGNSSGPHLHFETHVGGRAMNPVTFMNNVGLSI